MNERFCIICAHSEDYKELAQITLYGNAQEYANRHGYRLRIKCGDWKYPARHPISWDRLALVYQIMASGEHEWIYVCGADTLITNHTITLDRLIDDKFHFIIACDALEWNADSMLLRCSNEGMLWVKSVLALYDKYKDDPWVEQAAMIELRPQFKDIIKVVPQRVMNSYDYANCYADFSERHKAGQDCNGNDGQWQPGDFLIHWPNYHPLSRRIEAVNRTIPLIVK